MKKASFIRLIAIYSLFCVFVNLIHPVTPTLFINLNFPEYMFGVAYACMSIAVFISAPYWGRLGGKIGFAKVMIIGMPGYAFGQFIFGVASTPLVAMAGRFIAGLFSAATIVSAMAYVVSISNNDNRSRHMAYYAAITAFSGAMGYLLGGVTGDISIKLTFIVQIVGMLVTSILTFLFLADYKDNNVYSPEIVKKEAVDRKALYTMSLVIFLCAVFLCAFASTAYDNAFNYYIKAELNFPASYNGIIKAVIGIIILVANFTINLYIIKKTNLRKSLVLILLLCGITSFAVPFIPNILYFVLGNIVFFTFNSIYLPIQQSIVTMNINKNVSGEISGVFNSVTSAGKILGALFAGFIYTFGSKLPFFASSIAFLLAAAICIINYFQYKSR